MHFHHQKNGAVPEVAKPKRKRIVNPQPEPPKLTRAPRKTATTVNTPKSQGNPTKGKNSAFLALVGHLQKSIEKSLDTSKSKPVQNRGIAVFPTRQSKPRVKRMPTHSERRAILSNIVHGDMPTDKKRQAIRELTQHHADNTSTAMLMGIDRHKQNVFVVGRQSKNHWEVAL